MKSNVIRIVSVMVGVTLVSLVGTSRAFAQFPVVEYPAVAYPAPFVTYRAPVAAYPAPVAEYPVVASPPVAYTSVQPEVVGYQFQRRGLLGLRSSWNPVVAPVARTVVTPAPPVYTAVPTVVTPPAVLAPSVTQVEPVNPVVPVTYETAYPIGL